MVVTTMRSTTSLITKLALDYPDYYFKSSNEFHWSPDENVIFYDKESSDQASLLHELSHAILEHKAYSKDIELIELERNAWQYAKQTLSPQYAITIDENDIQDSLDTYRDWLHARSRCPYCEATGVQTKKNTYKCLSCSTSWRVNDARICALRRYTIAS
jgi:hypothetical protein